MPLLIFAVPKLEFCLLLSSHPSVTPENPNKSPGFSQNPRTNVPAFPQPHPGDQRPVPSTIPHPQLTPVCSSSGKRALSSFSADDQGTGSSLGFWLGEATQGIFQSRAGNQWKSESLDFWHSVASVQIILSECRVAAGPSISECHGNTCACFPQLGNNRIHRTQHSSSRSTDCSSFPGDSNPPPASHGPAIHSQGTEGSLLSTNRWKVHLAEKMICVLQQPRVPQHSSWDWPLPGAEGTPEDPQRKSERNPRSSLNLNSSRPREAVSPQRPEGDNRAQKPHSAPEPGRAVGRGTLQQVGKGQDFVLWGFV